MIGTNGVTFLRARWIPLTVILLTLAVLAGTILLACHQLRLNIRQQIARRDSQVLHALWLSQQSDQPEGRISESAADQLWAILETSRLRELIGFQAARLFDEGGNFVTAHPALAVEGQLTPEDLAQLKLLTLISHFHPAFPTTNLWMLPELDENTPTEMALLEINIPIPDATGRNLAGVAQFIFDGQSIAAELAALDNHLLRQAGVAFLASGAIVVAVLGLAFRRLQRSNDLLAQRTRSLLQANQELALAAKTAAIGAVTSHLIHGLKNPLSGLHQFVSSRGNISEDEKDGEWLLAISTTRRMQTLINDVVRVLREETECADYSITFEELGAMVARKMAPLAKQAEVELQIEIQTVGAFSNRKANLILLILENLIQNAIQATPKGRRVSLTILKRSDKIDCEVRDEGSGLPEGASQALFRPCVSSKEGGSGIGLAISKQLANYLEAELELRSSSSSGSTFALSLPGTLLQPEAKLPAHEFSA